MLAYERAREPTGITVPQVTLSFAFEGLENLSFEWFLCVFSNPLTAVHKGYESAVLRSGQKTISTSKR